MSCTYKMTICILQGHIFFQIHTYMCVCVYINGEQNIYIYMKEIQLNKSAILLTVIMCFTLIKMTQSQWFYSIFYTCGLQINEEVGRKGNRATG